MMEFIERSGPVIYAMALCSLGSTAVTIERFVALRRSRVLPRQIIDIVEAVQPGKDLSLAVEVCKKNPGVFSEVVLAGLQNADQRWEVMRDAVVDAGRSETPALERNLFWLQTSPLLGLLGTVFGMINMFASISLSGLGDPQILSHGLAEAMLATAEGLCIGIPTLVIYNFLSSRAERYIAEIESHANRMVSKLRPAQHESAQ